MKNAEHKNFAFPDETRSFGHGKAEIVQMNGAAIGRYTLEPGWRWSRDVQPIAGTAWCEAPHFQYQLSGRLRVRMENGTEFELGPGEVAVLPPGHDAWVVGPEPVVVIDWFGATHYGKT